ncbi:hypothetical protein Cgig2_004874 [Carnegiea gigantea]|uniref:Uncharacterized protein n=1 Tax=Carnegiea gigantea TaxID=171969 RepID=A0A9Q1JXG0_9CARY|nr:hypothetical protein Cgig2_004874 [Carnegiea gigantea]
MGDGELRKDGNMKYVTRPQAVPLPSLSRVDNPLLGKVALVAGGGSGMGRAVCYDFSLEGATVAFTYVKGEEDRDATDGLALIKEVKSCDAEEPIAIPTDLRYEKNCREVVESIEDVTTNMLRLTFEPNFFAYFFMARESLFPSMNLPLNAL